MGNHAAIRQIHRELKYVVDQAEAARLERLIAQEIPLRPRFAGERASIIRSVYLDYPDFALTNKSLTTPADSTKVRYKRYENPSYRSGTTDVSVWVEVKIRKGDLVTKERVPYPGVFLGDLFKGNRPPPQARYLKEILEAGELRPVAGVRYLRVAFEEPDESLRITIDRKVTFQQPYAPGARSTDVGSLEECVVEVKPMREIPLWFDEIMNGHPVSTFSKFERAARTLGLG